MPKDNSQTQNPQNNTAPAADDMPPIMMEDTHPPMMNDNSQVSIANSQTSTPSAVDNKPSTDTGSAAPADDVVMPSVVTSGPNTGKVGKKFGGGKVIATILGLFLLIGGAGAGVFLVQQNQDIREDAYDCKAECIAGGSGTLVCGCRCGETNSRCPAGDGNTDPNTNGTNSGGGGTDCDRQCGGPGLAFDFCMSASSTRTCNQEALARGYTVPIGSGCQPGQNCDIPDGYICKVGVNGYTGGTCTAGNSVPGTGSITSVPSCFCGTIQIDGGPNDGTYQMQCGCDNEDVPGNSPTAPPAISAVCQDVKAYSETWSLLTSTQLSQLDAGDKVNFCVTGTASSGSFDKARFTINSTQQPETTTVRPGGADFCQLYTIPTGVTTFNVTAQINHVTLGWK